MFFPLSTIGSFWMKEDWNITRSKIEPIFLFFSTITPPPLSAAPHLRVCLENCKIWLTQHQQHKSFVVAYMAGSFSLWHLSLQTIPSLSRHFSERNVFASFSFLLFLYPVRSVRSRKEEREKTHKFEWSLNSFQNTYIYINLMLRRYFNFVSTLRLVGTEHEKINLYTSKKKKHRANDRTKPLRMPRQAMYV
jgi:hypothetical protein